MFPTSPEMSTDEDKGFKQYLNSDASSSDPSDWGSVAAASPPSPLGKCDPWCSPLVFQCDSAWCWVVTGLPWILPRCVGTPFGGPPITRHPNMIDLGGIYNHCAWIIILLVILCRDYVVLWWTWKLGEHSWRERIAGTVPRQSTQQGCEWEDRAVGKTMFGNHGLGQGWETKKLLFRARPNLCLVWQNSLG